MKYFARLSFLPAVLVAVLAFSPLTFADRAADLCVGYKDIPASEAACEAGYKTGSCATFHVPKELDACNDGVAAAKTDAKNGTGDTTNTNGQTGTNTTPSPTPPANGGGGAGECGGTKVGVLSCDGEAGIGALGAIIKIAVNVLTVLIGIVATGGLAYAGVMYASARDNQKQVSDSLGIIRNIVIGLVMYGLTIGIVNWLIPGGIIG